MNRLIWFTLGISVCVACAATPIIFPYKWFHASPVAVWEFPTGKLLSDKPENDRLLSECKPVTNAQGKQVQKCGVIFLDELERLIVDYKQSKKRIIDLERQCGQSGTTI